MAITKEQARAELARRELEKRQTQQSPSAEQPAQQAPQQPNKLNVGSALMQPISKSLGGQSVGEFYDKNMRFPPSQNPLAMLVDFERGMSADVLDLAQTPATYIAGAVGKGISKGAQLLKPLLKIEKTLDQARLAKSSLESLRNIYGKAKDIALQEVKDIPVELPKGAPQRVSAHLRNPNYGVEFDGENVKGTVGNLDKVKTALNDILTQKDIIEAGKVERQLIKGYASKVNQSMVSAAEKAGHPELAEGLNNYHYFMDDYDNVISHLVDSADRAQANKLKTIFRAGAEEDVKESWKILSQKSPELKRIMGSQKNRELLKSLLSTKNLIKAGAVGGAAAGTKYAVDKF